MANAKDKENYVRYASTKITLTALERINKEQGSLVASIITVL